MLGFLRFGFLATLLGVALTACSDPPEDDGKPCSSNGPAFVVTVRVLEDKLPHDLTLDAQYGGGSEGYDLAHPPAKPEVLFCQVELVDPLPGPGGEGGYSGSGPGGSGSAAGHKVEVLVCQIWADSAVSVTVTGMGYQDSLVELTPEVDERCGVLTKSVDAALLPEAPPEGP